ncbi:glycosyltransferase family 61 protein [Isoptericola chiayiensis]
MTVEGIRSRESRIEGRRPATEPETQHGVSRVVVIADDLPPARLRTFLASYRDQELFVIAPAEHAEWGLDASRHRFLTFDDEESPGRHLERLGPVDRIVVVRSASAEVQAAMLRELLFHLSPEGLYVVALDPASEVTTTDEFGALLRTLAGDGGVVPRDVRELRRAALRVRVGRRWIRVRKTGRHFLKLRDDSATRLLRSRGSRTKVDELVVAPGDTFRAGTEIVSHGASKELAGLATTVLTPPLHLRHYQGHVGLVSNALTLTDHEVLPDSFRHHLNRRPSNPRLVDADARFGRVPQRLMPRDDLGGSYYLLDSENSGHFGHLLTEVISRLWGWDRAKQDDPDLRAIFRIRYPQERDPALERTIFSAFGIAEEDIAWVDHPVRLESMYAATPMFHNSRPHYVHPGIRAIWQRIRDGLPVQDGPTWEKVFVSRRDTYGNRRCLNREEVEGYFSDAGFEVIYPEDFSLSRQAQVFSQARTIAGFGGSGMFNALFADRLETMIVLTHEAYTARNEALIALPLDVRLHYFWNAPEIAHPVGGWTREAYKSAWTFDLPRHRDELEQVLQDG